MKIDRYINAKNNSLFSVTKIREIVVCNICASPRCIYSKIKIGISPGIIRNYLEDLG